MKLLIQNYGAHQCELRKHDKYGRFENTGANCEYLSSSIQRARREHYAMGLCGPMGPKGPWGPRGLGLGSETINLESETTIPEQNFTPEPSGWVLESKSCTK